MKKIMIGLIMVFLDFNLTLNNNVIGLIPDFIGYIIMVKGLIEMTEESPLFPKVRPYATGMAVYTGILYALDLFGVIVSLSFFTFLLGVISVTVSLYISYTIVMGVRDMEDRHGTDLNGEQLKSRWMIAAVFSIASVAALLFPVLAIIMLIAVVITSILFLVAFNRSKNLYESMRGAEAPGAV
jgi:hypothetical protein